MNSALPLTPPTHPFVVFERRRETHGLYELGEGPDLLFCVLRRLLHITELEGKKVFTSSSHIQ